MSQKNILVLGAAQSCLGIIKTIKRMGHKALVVGNNKDLPGIKIADHYLITEDNHVDEVISFAKKTGVDGIVPTPVDRPLVWMAQVAERLKLPFLSVEAAQNFRHKYRMKQCLQNAGVPCAKGILVESPDNLEEALDGFSFPLIVKPIDGYASRGVVKVDNHIELKQYAREAASFSSNAHFVVEEFIEGREFNAEGVCFQGTVEVYAIVEKVRDPFPRTIEMGHIVPPDITSEEEEIVVDTVSRAVLSLGMANGAFNAEIKIHEGKGSIIEVNGRLAGDFIISHLLKPTIGQDMEEAVVNIALGIAPEKARRAYQKHGIISFFNLPPQKRIEKVHDFSKLYDDKDLIWAHLFFQEGDIIPQVMHMGHRSGFVILTARNRKKLLETTEALKTKILNLIELI